MLKSLPNSHDYICYALYTYLHKMCTLSFYSSKLHVLENSRVIKVLRHRAWYKFRR